MTRSDRHLIQRQVIELRIGASSHGPALQEELARSFWARAVPELEAMFDRVASPDETLRLDRLEIDLGVITGVDWEPQFRRKLVAELARRLAQLRPVPEMRDVRSRSDVRPSRPMEQFLFFLVQGHLPWWGSKPRESWTETLLSAHKAVDWNTLHNAVTAEPQVRVRLIDSVSDPFLEQAVAIWATLPYAARVLERLAPDGLDGVISAQWRRGFWKILLDWVLIDGVHSERGVALMQALLAFRRSLFVSNEQGATSAHSSPTEAKHPAVSRTSQRHDLPASQREPAASSGDLPAPLREMPAQWRGLPTPWREWLEAAWDAEQLEQRLRSPPPVNASVDVSSRSGTAAPDASHPELATRRQQAQSEAIYLGCAGVTLLHPFLAELFRDRGLLKGCDFRDRAARQRAVHLVGLLGFGSREVPEYDLLVAKLLCGWAFEEPLEPAELDDDDSAACDALLRAVLKHWTALRSSSPDWLREQFLLRDGKLEGVDKGWRLTVERRAQDVLLPRLPWGIGVISLPWLQDRIFVRWLE